MLDFGFCRHLRLCLKVNVSKESTKEPMGWSIIPTSSTFHFSLKKRLVSSQSIYVPVRSGQDDIFQDNQLLAKAKNQRYYQSSSYFPNLQSKIQHGTNNCQLYPWEAPEHHFPLPRRQFRSVCRSRCSLSMYSPQHVGFTRHLHCYKSDPSAKILPQRKVSSSSAKTGQER